MTKMKMFACCAVAAIAVMSAQLNVSAVTVTVGDSTAAWEGFMNVSELPANGGAFVFGSGWGVGDLVATFDDPSNKLTLSPNTIGDPDPFWYVGGGAPGNPGNKIMNANLFIGDDSLVGQTVTFEGTVLANMFTAAHTTEIFIRDFAPDFSSVIESTVPATPGPFSVTLATDPTPGRHVQYGFSTTGENVWVTDTAPFGNVMIGTIPEPASIVLMGMAGLAMATMRRRIA